MYLYVIGFKWLYRGDIHLQGDKQVRLLPTPKAPLGGIGKKNIREGEVNWRCLDLVGDCVEKVKKK